MHHKERQLVKAALRELEAARKDDRQFRERANKAEGLLHPGVHFMQNENWRLSYVEKYLTRLLEGDVDGKGEPNPRVAYPKDDDV